MASTSTIRREDFDHLLRKAALYEAGVGVFVAVRAALVPDDFGVLGHYRAAAIAENREGALVHAGRDACRGCHVEPARVLAGGAHQAVGCEACHGPLGGHAAAPAAHGAQRPDGRTTCLRCHARGDARPVAFPQVDAAEHAPEGACVDCHTAHSPEL